MCSNLIDSYLQIDEDPEELCTSDDDMLNFGLDTSSQHQMLIHTQPIYLINTSKLQTPQQQVMRSELTNTLHRTRQSSIFSSDNNIQGLFHEHDELQESAAFYATDPTFTPNSEQVPVWVDKSAAGFALHRLPKMEMEYDGAEPTIPMPDDELLLQISAPAPHTGEGLTNQSSMTLAPTLDLNKFVQAVHTYHDDASWDSPEQYEFVHALTSKLSRYCGYFVADSKEMEYFDKIRLQEIEYRLCKTYFI